MMLLSNGRGQDVNNAGKQSDMWSAHHGVLLYHHHTCSFYGKITLHGLAKILKTLTFPKVQNNLFHIANCYRIEGFCYLNGKMIRVVFILTS